jgi:hypothetical protein
MSLFQRRDELDVASQFQIVDAGRFVYRDDHDDQCRPAWGV